MTFFFTTDGKSFVLTFNCSIHNMSTYSFIYVFKHPSSSIGRDFINGVLNMGGSGDGEAVALAMMRRRDRVVCDIFVA
jgi:hypothetical protein